MPDQFATVSQRVSRCQRAEVKSIYHAPPIIGTLVTLGRNAGRWAVSALTKMALKTCLRMLCNARDITLAAEVMTALETEGGESQREPSAIAQGYDRQGQRPALSSARGETMASLSQDLSGSEDKEAIQVRVTQETRPRSSTTTASRTATAPETPAHPGPRRQCPLTMPGVASSIWLAQTCVIFSTARKLRMCGSKCFAVSEQGFRLAEDADATKEQGEACLAQLHALGDAIATQLGLPI